MVFTLAMLLPMTSIRVWCAFSPETPANRERIIVHSPPSRGDGEARRFRQSTPEASLAGSSPSVSHRRTELRVSFRRRGRAAVAPPAPAPRLRNHGAVDVGEHVFPDAG